MIKYLKRGKSVSIKADDDVKVRVTVEAIIKDVESRSDNAVRDYSRKFDNWNPAEFQPKPDDVASAVKSLSAREIEDITFAQTRVRNFAQLQRASSSAKPYSCKRRRLLHPGRRIPHDRVRTHECRDREGAFGGNSHTQRNNAGIALIVMIETPEAVENAAAIASVEGVDGVFVGPNDLAHAMGFGDNWNAPEVQDTIAGALRAVAASGNCGGTIALTQADEEKYGQFGARYFASVTTSLITRAFKQAAGAGRQAEVTIAY